VDTLYPSFFWDARATSIVEQSIETFQNPEEMNMPLSLLQVVVENQPYYRILFEGAYGDQKIDSERILECLESFIASIHTVNTKFDSCYQRSLGQMVQVVSGQSIPLDTIVKQGNRTPHLVAKLPIQGFTESEQAGAALFFRNCGSCHNPILPYQTEFTASIGREKWDDSEDLGIGGHTGKLEEMEIFKIPSLRNIEFTGPYMHDGQMWGLDEVLWHYSLGITQRPNLHPLLKDASGNPRPMCFSHSDRNAIRDFLLTLSDKSCSQDSRWLNPFK
jgi:cytochrome c peroxidase